MLISQGVAAAADTGGASIMTFLLPIALIAVFYLLLIRPQRKRQKEMTQMQHGIQPGQEVMTGAGIIGTVRSVDDAEVSLEIAPGVETRFTKQAIVRTITPVDEATDAAGTDESAQEDSTDDDKASSLPLTHDDGSKKN